MPDDTMPQVGFDSRAARLEKVEIPKRIGKCRGLRSAGRGGLLARPMLDGGMTRAIRLLAGVILLATPALGQPDGRMAPGSGSGSAPGTGATGPDYDAIQQPKSNPDVDSGSTGGDEEEPRGSIGAGRIEPGGSGATTSKRTTPPRP